MSDPQPELGEWADVADVSAERTRAGGATVVCRYCREELEATGVAWRSTVTGSAECDLSSSVGHVPISGSWFETDEAERLLRPAVKGVDPDAADDPALEELLADLVDGGGKQLRADDGTV